MYYVYVKHKGGGMRKKKTEHYVDNKKFYSEMIKYKALCDEAERQIIAEYYQRCFARDLPKEWTNFLETDAAPE